MQAPPAPHWLLWAWVGAGCLLLLEYLLISLLFDAAAWRDVDGPLQALGHLGQVATVFAIAAFGTFVLRGAAIASAVRAQYQPQRPGQRLLAALAHVIAYPLLVIATAQLFREPDPQRVTALGLVLWLLAACLTVLTLLRVLSPLSGLRALAPKVAPALVIGLIAGAAAFGFGQLSAALWGLLGAVTLHVVYAGLSHLRDDVLLDAEAFTVGTPDFAVVVAPECSGLEGIGLILVFLGGYMALNRQTVRFPHALWLLPLAVVSVWTANAARIVALVMIGIVGFPHVALGGFHSKAGWVFFCLIALGFIAWLRTSRMFRAQASIDREQAQLDAEARRTTAAFLLPELVLIATSLVTGLFATTVDWLYGIRVLAALAVLWFVRDRLRALWVRPSGASLWIGVAVFAVWYALTPHHTASGEALRVQVMEPLGFASVLWIATRVLGSVLVVPVVEELAFRGYLMRRIVSADFDTVSFRTLHWPALIASSIAFGLLHADLLAAVLAGVAYGLAQVKRGQLADAAAAHAVTNALVALDVLVLGSWAQW